MFEIRNAVIKSVQLSNDDHGCLSAWLQLDYGGLGQGFGGYALFVPDTKVKRKPNYCGWFIWRCMDIAGVHEWSRIPGNTIRVKSDHSKVHAIGHIIKDDWFNPSDDFIEMENAP